MHGLEEYIFINNIGEIIQEMELVNDAVADNHCERLATRKGYLVVCYRKISQNYPSAVMDEEPTE